MKGIDIFIMVNGSIRKIPRCNVQLSEKFEEEKKKEDDSRKVQFGEKEKEENRIMTRSMTNAKKKEMKEEITSTFWMQKENSECYDDIAIYTVEIPVREHKKPDVIEAKQKEIENLEKYGVFEEVEDIGQEAVDSRWVVTQKEKSDGQKTKVKARLVAKGFQEAESPQSDSPTMLRESMKLFFSVAANEGFQLRKIDIRAAFLQADPLDRDVFMRIPKDIRKDGMIWRLKKPLYGLNDASRKFWLRMKGIFKDIGLVKLSGDEAVYYKVTDQGELEGMISTHVDDFDLAGTTEFVERIAKEIA